MILIALGNGNEIITRQKGLMNRYIGFVRPFAPSGALRNDDSDDNGPGFASSYVS